MISKIFLWSLWVELIGGRVHCTTQSHILFRWVLSYAPTQPPDRLLRNPPTHTQQPWKEDPSSVISPALSDTTEALLIINLMFFSPSKMKVFSKEVSPALLPGLGNVLPFNTLPHWTCICRGSTLKRILSRWVLFPKLTQSPNHGLRPTK